jgi:hypothetical protein
MVRKEKLKSFIHQAAGRSAGPDLKAADYMFQLHQKFLSANRFRRIQRN